MINIDEQAINIPSDIWTKILSLCLQDQPNSQQWSRLSPMCTTFRNLLTTRAELNPFLPQKQRWLEHVNKLPNQHNPHQQAYLNDCAKRVQQNNTGPQHYPAKSIIANGLSDQDGSQQAFNTLNYLECQLLHLMEIATTIKDQTWCYTLLDQLKNQLIAMNAQAQAFRKMSTLWDCKGKKSTSAFASICSEATTALAGTGGNLERLQHFSNHFISAQGKCVIC